MATKKEDILKAIQDFLGSQPTQAIGSIAQNVATNQGGSLGLYPAGAIVAKGVNPTQSYINQLITKISPTVSMFRGESSILPIINEFKPGIAGQRYTPNIKEAATYPLFPADRSNLYSVNVPANKLPEYTANKIVGPDFFTRDTHYILPEETTQGRKLLISSQNKARNILGINALEEGGVDIGKNNAAKINIGKLLNKIPKVVGTTLGGLGKILPQIQAVTMPGSPVYEAGKAILNKPSQEYINQLKNIDAGIRNGSIDRNQVPTEILLQLGYITQA